MKIRREILTVIIVGVVIVLVLALILPRVFRGKSQGTAHARVAIVIDDWGYNLRYINLLKEITVPLTISILPNLKFSTQVAQAAKELNQELIIHLPLEPETEARTIRLEKDTITCQMSAGEIIRIFEQARLSVPEAVGVSNHMGSRATKDRQTMSVIFDQLKKNKLFFLDNLVAPEKVCERLAKEKQIKFIARDFFLDNRDDYAAIRANFAELAEFALTNGQAVGILHAKPKSLEVLKEQIPLMQAKEIDFIFVSDLLK
ncbi:MAG: divergent polysaccharide deacetylase family protein [Candidatus Omnitrophica bacterium]|nr:divergent polysaccharide deacetylase family protein [Candidatus Omnitrophota bacterium]